MCKAFFTEFTYEGNNIPVSDLLQIATRYIQGPFVSELVPLVPITILIRHLHPDIKLFYLIKVHRVSKGFTLFDVQKWIKLIKSKRQESMHEKVK